MGRSLRRSAGRACAAAAAVCLALTFVSPSVGAASSDGVPRPDVFRGSASSEAISIQADREAFLPVPEVFKFIALDGAAQYESSHRQARASLLFPGNGLILGPSLVCGTFGGMFPAQFKPILDTCLQYQYPLTVFADDFKPDGSTTGQLALGAAGDPISTNAVGARAHTGEEATTTDAVIQDLRVLGLPAFGPVALPVPGIVDTSLLNVDNATSRTSQRIVKGVLVVDAITTMSGVHMLGGLIDIATMRSESIATDNANGKRTAVATLQMTGVTIAGVPVVITDKGIGAGVPPSGSGPIGAAQQQQLNDAIKAFGIHLSILPSTQNTNDRGNAVAGVGGLLLEFSRDVQGLPTIPGPIGALDPNGMYTATIQLGQTAARGLAANFGVDPITEDLTSVLSSGLDAVGSTDFGSSAYDVPVGGIDTVSQPILRSTPQGHSGALGNGNTHPAQLAASRANVFGGRLRTLYLAMMFAVLALCIAPRLSVPARLPGRRRP